MANSSTISAGDDILASQYNNLRKDVLDTSLGHTHDGANSKVIANDAIIGAMIDTSVVDGTTLEQTGTTLNIKDAGVLKGKLHPLIAGEGLIIDGDSALAVNDDDTTLEISSDILRIKNEGVGANKLGDAASYANARTRYLSFSGSSFVPMDEAYTWILEDGKVISGDTGVLKAIKSVELPFNALITSFKAYWFRDDASAPGEISLVYYLLTTGNKTVMANADSDAETGNHSVEDTSITDPSTGANAGYCVEVTLTPNDSAGDVYLRGILITYTVTLPLP